MIAFVIVGGFRLGVADIYYKSLCRLKSARASANLRLVIFLSTATCCFSFGKSRWILSSSLIFIKKLVISSTILLLSGKSKIVGSSLSGWAIICLDLVNWFSVRTCFGLCLSPCLNYIISFN